jgi:hypothetical protein
MSKDIFDFGFSIVSEEELKKTEIELQHTSNKTVSAKNDAIVELWSMVTPLLNNLLKDPEKGYIYWPNRTDKLKQFIAKGDAFVKQSIKD